MSGDTSASAGGKRLVAILSGAYLISAVDRQALALLVEPIKADLRLTDTEIGWLQGIAFMLIYATAAIPAGLMVDRVNRLRLISMAMLIWSVFTALCGLAQNFWSIFIARAGVGVGESALTPASYSLLTERFDAAAHARVLGLYHCGAALGAGLAYILCGWLYALFASHRHLMVRLIGDVDPWRTTFIALALPGILLAIVMLRMSDKRSFETSGRKSVSGVKAFYTAYSKLLGYHHLAVAVSNIAIGATSAWTAVYFIRTFGLSIQSAGLMLGIAATAGGLTGLIGGAYLTDMLFRKGPHLRLVICVASGCIGLFSSNLLYQASSPEFATTLFGIVIMCSAIHINASAASLQYLAPPEIRGTVSAIFFFSISIVGSLGAPLAAMLSDGAILDLAGIGEAMTLLIPLCFAIATVLFLACYREYRRAVILLSPRRSPD